MEAFDVRGAEALLARAVEHRDEVELGGDAVGDLAGAVGRVVVDHEDVDAQGSERVQHLLDVLALVERRQADRHRGHEASGYGMRRKAGVSGDV